MSGEVKSNVFNSNGLNDVVFKRNDVSLASLTTTDFKTEANINVVSQGQVKCDIINSYGDDNLSIRRYGTEYLLLNNNPAPIAIPCVQVASGVGFTTENFFANEYRSKDDNVNITFYGGNSTATGKVNYMTYGRANEDITFHRDVNIDASYSLSVDLITGTDIRGDTIYGDSFRNRTLASDTTFLGGNATGDGRITYMTYRRTQEDLRILRDVLIDAGYKISANVYDSSSNADVYLKRNAIDYIQLGGTSSRTRMLTGCQSDVYDSLENSDVSFRRNGIDFFYLRNGKVELNTGIGLKTDEIDTIGDTNLVVKQNAGTILTYDVGDVSYPNGIFKFDKDVSINTANYLQCNTIKAHIFDTHDSLEPNDVSFRYNGTTYMFYDQSLTNFQVRTDIVSNQDITCVALTETFEKRLKEDIDDFNSNCIELIKQTNVKKYKFKDDKNKKTNIGFIADEVLQNTPDDIENIVDTGKEYLSMNYGRMCCLLWKCCQEQQEKIEHLEASVYELQEAMKELKKPKPKAKSKPKAKDTLVEF